MPAFLRNWTPRKSPEGYTAVAAANDLTRPQAGVADPRTAEREPNPEPQWTAPQPVDTYAPRDTYAPTDTYAPMDGDPTRRSRLVLAAAAGVVVAVIVSFALVGLGEAPPPQSADSLVVPPVAPPPIPSAAVSILPKPSSSLRPSRSPSSVKPSTARKTKAPVKTASPVPEGALVAGSTIGLEIAGFEGFRVRHRDADVGIGRVGADSSSGEKADARFRVREGLGSSSCLSFESVNSPGRFLRHRDFVLRLDARDGSRLFDQDATFCPQKGRGGNGMVLRSVNYPDRALAVRRGDIGLDDDRATTFEVRPPL